MKKKYEIVPWLNAVNIGLFETSMFLNQDLYCAIIGEDLFLVGLIQDNGEVNFLNHPFPIDPR